MVITASIRLKLSGIWVLFPVDGPCSSALTLCLWMLELGLPLGLCSPDRPGAFGEWSRGRGCSRPRNRRRREHSVFWAVPRTCDPGSPLDLWNPVSSAVTWEESVVLKQPIWKKCGGERRLLTLGTSIVTTVTSAPPFVLFQVLASNRYGACDSELSVLKE